MSRNPDLNPANTLSVNDPGDDTQRRYRYQAAYTAVVSLELLNDNGTAEIKEIFCEHHEDTLLHRLDGTFVGIQVKTRASGRDLFKASDDQIINAIKRFTELSINHPGYFSRFVIATNYAFWSSNETSDNLPYILNLAKSAMLNPVVSMPKKLENYIRLIASRINSNGSINLNALILQVLATIELQDDLPKFDDIEARLAKNIRSCYDVGDACFDDLLRGAKALINHAFDAASLQHTSPRQLYFSACRNPDQLKKDNIIDGKRITKSAVQKILAGAISTSSVLATHKPINIKELPFGITNKLELKMAKGRISAANIDHTKDHKYSTELMLQKWLYKYDAQVANQRYQQLSVIVGNECQEAYDLTYRGDTEFGQAMLKDLRQRLRNRLNTNPDLFFRCTYEHLLGIAGILTESCKVWWSEIFEISDGKSL